MADDSNTRRLSLNSDLAVESSMARKRNTSRLGLNSDFSIVSDRDEND